jgi:hypothetical protein
VPLKDNVIEGILESRQSPFSRNKGFSEREDPVFQKTGYTTNGSAGTSYLVDVRSLYGFFLWLQNLTGETVNFTVFFSYKNFSNIISLINDNDWVTALDAADSPITGALANGINEEVEFIRGTSRVTAVRLDIDSSTTQILNGVFSGI